MGDKWGFKADPGGFQQVGPARWCYLVGIGVKGEEVVLNAMLGLSHKTSQLHSVHLEMNSRKSN